MESIIPHEFYNGENVLIADYIIIGSGPGACVAARRLSDESNNSVIMFEAGENNDNDKLICCLTGQEQPTFPSLIANHFNEFFWPFRTVQQGGINNRDLQYTGGRLFGGSSSINGEIYVRGSRSLYKEWMDSLGGDPSWSPEMVGEYIKRMENYIGTTQDSKVRGVGGMLNIRQTQIGKPENDIQQAFISVSQGMNIQIVNDYNTQPLSGPEVEIHSAWQLTEFPNGKRANASMNFLPPEILERMGSGVESKIGIGKNGRKLLVIFKSTVTRILLKNLDGNIVPEGVEWLQDGKVMHRAIAKKRVLVGAGIQSATLLQRSGIGPKSILEKANVPVIVDNPNIGAKLEDQQLFFPLFLGPPTFKPTDFTSPYLGGAFLPDPRLLLPNPPLNVNPERRTCEFYAQYLPDKIEIAPGIFYNIYLLISENLRPTSIGSIKILSDDPHKPIQPDYGFINERDRSILRAMIQIYVKRFQDYVTTNFGWIPITFKNGFSDSIVDEFINNNLYTSFHYAKMVPMGTLYNGGACDGSGEVYGTKKLHVIDNSLQPVGVDGNPQSSSYLFGWKIVGDIMELDRGGKEK